MIAFQKYCQVHQVKMLFFTMFFGMMTFFMFIIGMINVIKEGLVEAVNDPITMTGLVDFPASFLLFLLLQKIFNLYIQGYFFTSFTLNVLQTIAKLAILLGMVVKPGIELSLLYFTSKGDVSVVSYFGCVDFAIAIVGYVLHIGTAVYKISRDLEKEQELTV
jgi:hypothetical protein